MNTLLIEDVQRWQLYAPKPPPDDPVLLKRLTAALALPFGNENMTEALKSLRTLGFVLETPAENPSPCTNLAHHIACTLLNFSIHHGTSSPFVFSLQLAQHSINIPLRSNLLFVHLSNILCINIFIFSSRAKPRAYTADSSSSIAFFHRVDSFHGTSEYCVIAPSSHIPGSDRVLLPAPPPTFQSPVEVATFRRGSRTNLQSTKKKVVSPDLQTCINALDRICADRVATDIRKAVKDIMSKKKFKNGESRESLLATKGPELKHDMMARTSVPRGTLQNALGLLRQEQDLDPCFGYVHLRRLLLDGVNLTAWIRAVESSFDMSWQRELEQASEEDHQRQVKVEEKEDDSKDEQIRTCTVTLKQILRPDLMEDYSDIVEIAEGRQRAISNTVDELCVLIQKTLLVVTSGVLYDDVSSQSPKDPFDITQLFPSWFTFRSDINPLINIAQLPPRLQTDIEAGIKKPKSQDDLAHLFSQDHIQFLHSQFLSPRREHNSVEGSSKGHAVSEEAGSLVRGKHELWSKAAEVVRESSSTADIPASPQGMTTTINEHIRLLSTAVGNLWTGSIYKKSLDYLLRILLRLHLAPDRESKYWNRTHVAVQKQAQVKETNLKKSRKKWKSKLKKSCDRLAHLVSRGTNNDRAIGAVLRSLNNIASQRPVSIQTKIPNIECRLAEMAMGTVIDEPVCPDLDGEDEDGEEDDEGRGDEVAMEIDDEEAKPKEPSRARLRSLQAVLKMLVESPNISHDINWSWVKKSGYKGNDFTEKECRVVAYLANLLRLFIPKRRPRADGKGYQDSLAHVALRAPIVLIANSVLRAAGYPEFTRRNAPQTSSASLDGLQLGAVGLYEAFCGRGERQFDVQDASKNPLTNYITLQSSPENKRAIFESFFNMRKVEKVCSDHGLTFRDRITYVDEWTIRLTGSVVAHGANRSGYPVVSAYDERKKRFQEQADTWVDKFIDSGLNAEKVKELAEVNEACTKQLEDDIKPFRKVVKERQTIQSSISYEVGFGGSSYEELHSARDQLRQARRMLVPREEALRNQRQITYHYNKMAEAAEKLKDDQPKESSVKTKKFSAPTWDLPAVEDSCEYLDLSKIVAESEAKNRAIALSGTDYGICKMSETVAMTLKGMQGHFARYDMLQGSSGQDFALDENRARGSMKITAGLLNSISHTSAMLKNRQKRLLNNDSVRQSLQKISNASKTQQSSLNMDTIDATQVVRRDVRETLRQFERSKAQRKAKHNQELRSKRAISKICAAERRFVQKHCQDDEAATTQSRPNPVDGWCAECLTHHINHSPEDKEFSHSPVCPKTALRAMPVMFIGAAGTGVGSRIKGHARRGGKKMRQEHSRYCPVAVTDEYNTSKVCVTCFQRLQYARSRRIVKGKVKTITVKGSQECTNPDCESFRRGHTIKARDVNSAAAIAIAGASTLLHPERKRLPPFSRNLH